MQLPDQMYKNYILRRQEDFEQLTLAVQNQNITLFKKVGHQIIGNASSFGFDELVRIGNKMQSLEPEMLSTDGSLILKELQAWISSKKEHFKIT